MFELGGRRALVTGSGRGMGVGIARTLGRCGARVFVNDLAKDRAEETAAALCDEGLEASPLPFDVTDFDAYAAALAEAGPLDILVANAGIPTSFGGAPTPFLETPVEQWTAQVALNMFGVMNGVRAAVPGMIERGFGRVITISSDSGRTGVPGYSVYGASKAGALQFTRTLAKEIGFAGVTANIVSLGLMDNVSDELMEGLRPFIAQTPVQRAGSPRDVGAAVAFLCSDEAEWITGQTLSVNGGFATY